MQIISFQHCKLSFEAMEIDEEMRGDETGIDWSECSLNHSFPYTT